MSESRGGVANTILRLASVASKAVLVVAFLRYGETSDLAQYTLYSGAIGFFVLLVGGDVYAFAHRQLVSLETVAPWYVVWNHFWATSVFFAAMLPATLLPFVFGSLRWQLAVGFVSLLFVEHLAQESYRLLVLLGKRVRASVALVLRTAAWTLVLCACAALGVVRLTIESVAVSWLIGSALALVFSWVTLLRLIGPFTFVGADVAWMKRAAIASMPLWVGTALLKLLSVADRYVLDAAAGASAVAALGVFSGAGSLVVAVVDSGVSTAFYPAVMRAGASNSSEVMSEVAKRFWARGLRAVGVATVAAGVATTVVIVAFPSAPTSTYSWMAVPVLLSAASTALSAVPHAVLVATEQRRPLLVAHAMAVMTMVVCAVLAVRSSSVQWTVAGILLSSVVLVVQKTRFAGRVLRASQASRSDVEVGGTP